MTTDDTPESGVAAARRWRTRVAGETTEDLLDVVFVCTGNRFRSPLAEALFAHAASTFPVVVRSAGTLDSGPHRAFPETLQQAHRFGLDLSEHRARSVIRSDLSTADVVIGFEQMHVAVAVMNAGVPRDKAFTLPELVQLLEQGELPAGSTPSGRARAAIEQANATRQGTGQSRLEVADPVGHSDAVYERTADEIRDLVARLVRELFSQEGLAKQ